MKTKVLLGMSGGVDSSVAAMMLQKKGYEVNGVTFLFSELEKENSIIVEEARNLAKSLKIKHTVLDLKNEFNELIVRYFTNQYLEGKTPFPCAKCNPEVKFKNLLKVAEEQECEYIATGHYAQIMIHNSRNYIFKGVDPEKDQSFFLWGLDSSIINRLILPLGSLNKVETREYANQLGFKKLSQKKDSLGVCFIEGNDYRDYLKSKGIKSNPGNFVNKGGEIIGQHSGIINYTIGQRHGLGLNTNKPVFVSKMNAYRNEILLTGYDDLYKNKIFVKGLKFINKEEVTITKIFTLKIRYRLQNTPCRVELIHNDKAIVHLEEPLAMIADGQTAVFYEGDRVVGGGFIESSE